MADFPIVWIVPWILYNNRYICPYLQAFGRSTENNLGLACRMAWNIWRPFFVRVILWVFQKLSLIVFTARSFAFCSNHIFSKDGQKIVFCWWANFHVICEYSSASAPVRIRTLVCEKKNSVLTAIRTKSEWCPEWYNTKENLWGPLNEMLQLLNIWHK